MRKTGFLTTSLTAVTLLAGCTDESGPGPLAPSEVAAAGLGTPFDASKNPIDLAVIGDVPYGAAAIAVYPEMIDRINRDPKVRRVVHVGDIKSGSTACTDEWFEYILASFRTFSDPLVYTPGDNEWTDCHRPNNGGYDPLERLAKLRNVFFADPGLSHGGRQMRVEAQPGYPENQLWIEAGVVFVAVHAVGSNNSLNPWTGETAPSLPQLAEWTGRDAANRSWLERAFDLAEQNDAAGVAVFLQADMWAPGGIASGADFSGHQAFVETLAERAAQYGSPVVLVAGDTHEYRVERPLVDDVNYAVPFDVPNLTHVVIAQSILGDEIVWLRLQVDPRTPEVFRWQEVR